MLHVDAVTCIKQERCLFEDLSFSINAGEIMQLEGPNGAGKTSLLRILAGFSEPMQGQVRFMQTCIRRDYENYAQQVLFIGHKTGVNTQLNALENCQFWLDTHGLKTDLNIYDVLSNLGLVGLEDVPVRQLSAGQQRRVALARLWLNDAKLWFLDEPFTAVDKKGVALLQQRFAQHLAQQGAILLTSHQDLTAHFSHLSKLQLEYRI
ncbi:cytochrome c biogenesis heme-transporting ATPase CcmA [Pseudoalteromonas sp. SW0106-04]|uniref:cytochrome c biogenesis heme-transporting ATPase CcmA n=1 Tax=Pseudoalteromonas sp. SW0106-04 TaxID=1702169 RepID=UPI0009E7464F|nr:cytochrome c biogenesis heme-transporting ATPase CcmA [Pseudoalteromonas sp. SW0106-04]